MKTRLVGIFFLFALSASAFAQDWRFNFVDDFDGANNGQDFGLNSNLDNRHHYGPWAGRAWVRKDGHWIPKPSNPANLSQVNHANAPNRLSFFVEHSAVMLNLRIWPGGAGRYRVSYKTDPRISDSTDGSWTSFMLDSTYTASGYPTQVDFAFLIRSSGVVSVIQNGNSKVVSGNATPADVYDVVLDIKPGKFKALINGKVITANLDEALPVSAHPYLGAYIADNSGVVSWFDDLVLNTQRGTTAGHLSKYGYYWADSPAFGSHLDEVEDYTNFNFIDIDPANIASLSNQYYDEKCHPKKCVLHLRWQFWPDASGQLRLDWLSKWGEVRDAILADNNEDLLAALYIVDEPFHAVNASLQDYEMVLTQLKQDFPDLPLMTFLAWPGVNNSLPYVSGLNWVGTGQFVNLNTAAGFDVMEYLQATLQDQQPGTPIFIVPQNSPDPYNTPYGGAITDEDIARNNWLYYDLAINDDSVTAILNFGLWSHIQPSEGPVTIKTQKLIGEAITDYTIPPAGC